MPDGDIDGSPRDLTAPTAPGSSGTRRLYREPTDKKVSGVCAGLADYFELDPTVVRLLTVALALVSGIGPIVVAYIVAAFVIPARPASVPRPDGPRGSNSRANNGLFILVVVLGLFVLFDGWWWGSWFTPPTIGVTLVALGVWLLFSRDEPSEKPSSFTTGSVGRTTLLGEAASERDQSDGEPAIADPATLSDDSAGPRGEVPPPVPPWGPPSSPQVEPPRSGRSPGMLAFLLLAAGLVSLLAVFDVWDMGLEEGIGAALVVMGAALVMAAWRGHAVVLIAVGLPTLGLLVLADVVDLPLDGGTGDRTIRVDTLSELRRLDDEQEMLAGDLTLDLDEAPFTQMDGQTVKVVADVGLGGLTVYLPPAVTADVEVDIGTGNLHVEGNDDESGVDVDRTFRLDGTADGGRIDLDLHVGLGEVRVFHG